MALILSAIILSLQCLIGVGLLFFIGFAIFTFLQHRKYDHLPGPKRTSFFGGNIYQARKARQERGVIIHQVWAELSSEYKPLFVYWFFYRPVIIITNADLVKEILITRKLPKDPFGYSHFAEVFGQRLVGGGLLSEVNHRAWERKRQILNPAFHRNKLHQYIEQFNTSCDLLLEKLAEFADGKTEVRMAEELVRVALDVIGKAGYDLDLNSVNSPDTPIPTNTRIALEGFVGSFRNPFHKYLIHTYKEQNKAIDAIKVLREASKGVIEQRMDAVKKGDDERDDILSYILKLSDYFPGMDELIDHFITFIVGGQETTTNHMAFALMAIASNPDVEKRVLEEIEEILGSRQSVTFDDLHKFTYLDQVLREALRLHPPTPAITRHNYEEIALGGYLIPAGSSIMANAHVMQHNPTYWDDPEKFDPERFNSETGNKHHYYAYFPFSLGPHQCIGMYFGQYETKVMLARFLQTFKMKLTPGQSLKVIEQMTIRPKDGVKCTLTLR